MTDLYRRRMLFVDEYIFFRKWPWVTLDMTLTLGANLDQILVGIEHNVLPHYKVIHQNNDLTPMTSSDPWLTCDPQHE